MTMYPVFDSDRHDIDKAALAAPIGRAADETAAANLLREWFAGVDKNDPIVIARVELAERFGVWGYFPVFVA